MRRRDFLRSAGVIAAGSIAGCSGGFGKDNTDQVESTDTTENTSLPDPENRDYRDISHGEDLPQSIENRAAVAEEKTDQLVFDEYSELLEREESYVEVADNGTQTVLRDVDDEQVEQDLYGLSISVDASQQLEPENMQDFAVDALEGIAPMLHQGFYDSDQQIPDEDPINELTVEVSGEDSYGSISYEMPGNNPGGNSIEDFEETVITYLEEGRESTAIEESVKENFNYTEQ